MGSQEATAEEAGFSLEVPEQRLLLVAICRNSGRSAGFIEELAVAARFVAEKEARTCQTGWSLGLVESEAAQGLMQKIDMDDVERKTWSKQWPWCYMICASLGAVLRPILAQIVSKPEDLPASQTGSIREVGRA